jgi:hypothetical protein
MSNIMHGNAQFLGEPSPTVAEGMHRALLNASSFGVLVKGGLYHAFFERSLTAGEEVWPDIAPYPKV